MSAYLDRLIGRFSNKGEPGEDAALSPALRSRSPIAAVDQRLGVSEELGHGLGGIAAEPAAEVESPEPAALRSSVSGEAIQRKATSSVAGPAPAPSTPAPAPAPTRTHPDATPAATPAPTPKASPEPSHTPEPESRPAPLDPGALFDPFPLHFDDERPTPSPESAASAEAPSSSPREAAISTESSARASEAPAWIRPNSTPKATASEHSPISSPPPWRALPLRPNAEFSAAPALEPRPQTRSPEPSARPQLYIVPSPTPVEPLIPEAPAVPQARPTTQAPTRPRRAETEAPPRPSPQPPATQTATPRGGKLTIESISVIGPLDRHFPNRRLLRLRYR